MAKVSYKNGAPSWELDAGESKIWNKVISSKYSQEDNNALLTSTQQQAKSIIERLNSSEYKDTATRVQLQKDLYSYQNNLARLRLRGYDVTKAEADFNQLQSYANNQSRTFAPFKTEKEYEDWKIGWLNTEAETTQETATARQERYKTNETRKEELKEELPWYASTIMPNWMENWFMSKEDEARRDEYETIKAENNQYKRTQSPLDEYYTPETPEFLENGAYRDYTNATKEDLQKHNATQRYIESLLKDGNHYYDSNGNIINATTKEIEYVADDLSRAMYKDSQDLFSGGFFDTDKSNNAVDQFYNSMVQDKLGMFLSASEDDLADAYSELSSNSADVKNTWASILQEGDQKAWKYLEPHELNIYYNLYKTQGQAAAYEYLDKMATELTRRETMARQKEIDEASGLEQVWLNVKSIPQKVFGGAVAFVEDAANIVRGEDINPYSKAHSWQNDAQYVRQVTAEDINEATGNIALPWVGTTFGDVYQSLISAADSAVGKMIGGNAYGVLMGMGAASSEMKELWEKGADTGQMVAGGLLAGAAEMVFEKYSIDKLVNIGDSKTIKQLVVNGLKQGGVEATEEMFTEVANTITNSIIMGSQSDWVDMETFVKNVVNSGIGGFISGNTMGSVVSAVNYTANKSKFKQTGTDIIKQGGTDTLLNLANEVAGVTGDKNLFKYSNKAATNISKGNTKKAALEVGRTSALLQDNIINQNQSKIQSALIEKGMSKKEAKRVSEYLTSTNKLTDEQISEVKGNETIKAVVKEILGSPESSINNSLKKVNSGNVTGAQGVASDNFADNTTHSQEQSAVLESFSDESLQDAISYHKSNGGNIPLHILGTSKGSTMYKALESAGLINEDGTVNAQALVDEFNRRHGKQSQKEAEDKNRNYFDNLLKDKYDAFLSKKPIKVSKSEWASINSKRTTRYGDMSQDTIPVIDYFEVGVYNELNQGFVYFVRNNGKFDFDIISKRKLRKAEGEKNSGKQIDSVDEKTRTSSRFNQSDNQGASGDKRTVRGDDSFSGNNSTSEQGTDFDYGNDNRRRTVKSNSSKADSVDGSAFSSDYETTDESDSIFTEPDVRNNPNDSNGKYQDLLGIPRELTEEQKIVKDIGKALGLEVDFNYRGRANGKIQGNKVSINPNAVDPLRFIFKHEIMHHFENSKHYDRFMSYLFNESDAFKDWLNKQNFGTLAAAMADAKKRYGDIGYEKLKREVVADFVGDTLFGKGDIAVTESFLKELARKDRNLFERLVEWLESLVKRLRGTAVEKDIVKLEQMVKRLKETVDTSNIDGKVRHSYAGQRAATANKLSLETAKQRIKDGDDSETVRKETGWFKGMDGKWRFEISDRELLFNDEVKIFINSLLNFNKALRSLHSNTQMSKEEYSKALQTIEKYNNVKINKIKLGDIVKHDALFAAYPELKNINVNFSFSDYEVKGEYILETGDICINERYPFKNENDILKTLIHEIQHAIQVIEGFEKGSSNVLWEQQTQMGNTPRYDNGKKMSNFQAYRNTAGEIEARDVARRLSYDDTKRENKRPDIDRKNVVSNKFVLDGYTETIKTFWKENGNAVAYENKSKLAEFVEKAVATSEKNEVELYFGKVNRIVNSLTSRVVGKSWFAKNVVLNSEDVKKILDPAKYGQDIHKKNQGEFAVTTEHLAEIPNVFCNAEFINVLEEKYNGYPIFTFEKSIGDKKITVFVVEDEISGNLNVQMISVDNAEELITTEVKKSTTKNQYSISGDQDYIYQKGKASFTEQRLNSLFDEHSLGEGKRAEHSNAFVAYISPDEFLGLTSNETILEKVQAESTKLDVEELRREQETPFLEYNPKTGEVVNHEGRHRMVALKADGIEKVAVVLKPANDSFERRTPQDISLTGQRFKNGQAVGRVTVSNAIPLSEKYRNEAVAGFAENSDADIRYSMPRNKKITTDGESSVKEQIKSHLGEINRTEVISEVAGIQVEKMSKRQIHEKANELFGDLYTTGIIRTDGIVIEINKKLVNKGLNYLNTNAEFASLFSVPSVLQKGIKISEHINHKKRGYNTITIAGRVRINGKVGVVGVVVTQVEGRNKYKVHRILMPDGSLFEYENTEPTSDKSFSPEDENNMSISSVSNTRVTQNNSRVNTQYMQKNENNTKHSIPRNADTLTHTEIFDLVDRGEMTADEGFEVLRERYGSIRQGEKAKEEVLFPKKISDSKTVSLYTRTAAESGHLDEGMQSDLKKEILKGGMTYKVISDDSAMARADGKIQQDFDGAVKEWEASITSGKMLSKNDIALGERLLQQAAENGNSSDTIKYIAELAEAGTRMGQSVQALSLLKKMTGIGKLYNIQRSVDTLNKDIEQKYRGKKKPVEINPDLAQMLVDSKTIQEAEAIANDMLKDIADQAPVTFLDKWNAWRYLSMLGNPKTHIRNLVGNAVFMPAVKLKDVIGVVGEKAISKGERTKAIAIKKSYKDFAAKDFNNVKDILSNGGKMNQSDTIREQQKIFKTKFLEKLRKFSFSAMEAEDVIFLKMHYTRALGGFLQARGLNLNKLTEQQLVDARDYAITEALKATYRDVSKLATALGRFQYSDQKSVRAFGMLMEGVLPFKKTPINILKRGVEYSPIGLLKAITKGSYDLKNGKITSAEFIDGLAAGLTGTGILALGALLYSLGLISIGIGYDEPEDEIKRMNGEQEYAITIGDFSYTIDWMVPAALPLIVGAELYSALTEEGEVNAFARIVDVMTTIAEPITNLSMLSGIEDTINAVSYSDNKLTELITSTAFSYLSQALPTLGGQVARSFDDTRRSNYIDKNSPVPTVIQSLYQKAIGKVPFLENTKIPYINAWGEKESNGSVAERTLENFVSPGYASTKNSTAVNDEVARIYLKTGENGVIPKRAEKSFQVNGETKYLTAEEYVTFATEKGQLSKQYAEKAISAYGYDKLSDNAKAELFSKLYSYAGAQAKTKVSDYELSAEFAKPKELEKIGVDPVDYFIAKVVTSTEYADTDGSGSVTKKEYKAALKNSGLDSATQSKILNSRYKRKN